MPSHQLCPQCGKTPDFCICASIEPLTTRLHLLILQHPQEPDKELGTARILHRALTNSSLRVGLSWRNLAAALGQQAMPNRWAVLHRGSGPRVQGNSREAKFTRTFELLTRRGDPVHVDAGIVEKIEGLILLDGTWSQAKTLWWRNAWLLKCQRVILNPSAPSLYGRLRREPRRECLSTLEAAALALEELGEQETTVAALRGHMGRLLALAGKRRQRRRI